MREKGLFRKIQLIGGSTYTVSLPKEWVRSIKLKPGDYVSVISQPDDTILISPRGSRFKRKNEATIEVDTALQRDSLIREIIGFYLAGYNVIRVSFEKPPKTSVKAIKDELRKRLIGVEAVSESSKELMIQALVGVEQLPVKTALKKMVDIVASMVDESIIALRKCDESLAREIAERDDEADRFYFYVVRQLKRAVVERSFLDEIGLKHPRECLGYRIIMKSIERAADHASRIASRVAEVGETPEELLEWIDKMSGLSVKMLQDSIDLLYHFDIKKAHSLMENNRYLREIKKDATRTLYALKLEIQKLLNLAFIIDSLERIGEYSADIVEIAINLSIEPA